MLVNTKCRLAVACLSHQRNQFGNNVFQQSLWYKHFADLRINLYTCTFRCASVTFDLVSTVWGFSH